MFGCYSTPNPCLRLWGSGANGGSEPPAHFVIIQSIPAQGLGGGVVGRKWVLWHGGPTGALVSQCLTLAIMGLTRDESLKRACPAPYPTLPACFASPALLSCSARQLSFSHCCSCSPQESPGSTSTAQCPRPSAMARAECSAP